jgi:hypothetical protein
MPAPISERVTGSISAINCTGNRPSSTQPQTSQAMPIRSQPLASRARASFSSRGWPRKMIPKNLTMV